jgi:hypothetical protein
MNKALISKKFHPEKNNFEIAFKTCLVGIILLSGTWGVLKLTKEILKELEGMGL